MSLGDAWADTTPGSVSKLNKVTVISGTGTYIASLVKDSHILFRADDSTGGLIANHYYGVSADGNSLIDLTDTDPHTHSSTSTGGTMFDVTNANKDVLDSGMSLCRRPQKANWIETVTSTGSITDDVDGTSGEHSIKLLTGGTGSSTASIRMPSIEMDMSKRSWFKCMQRLSSAADVAFRAGYGMDNLSSADENNRQYGVEGCTTVNGNYFVRSATGSARSATDSGVAFTTNRTSLRCEHYPDLGTPKIDLYINEGTVFTKTSQIPTTYLSDNPNPGFLWRWNIKNNAGSDKNLFCYGVRLCYQTSKDWSTTS